RLVSEWTAGQGARELTASLQKRGIAAAKSQNFIDLISDQHLWAREFYRMVVGGVGQARRIVGTAWKMSRGEAITHGAPRLGAQRLCARRDPWIIGGTATAHRGRHRALAARSSR